MLSLILAIASSAMVSIIMRLSDRKVTGNIAMLTVNFLSLNISSIALMLTAGLISLAVFKVKGGMAE